MSPLRLRLPSALVILSDLSRRLFREREDSDSRSAALAARQRGYGRERLPTTRLVDASKRERDMQLLKGKEGCGLRLMASNADLLPEIALPQKGIALPPSCDPRSAYSFGLSSRPQEKSC